MSSRALRRAQRELEEKKQLELLERENAHDEEESEEEDEAPAPKPAAKPSLFAMLGDAEGEDDDDEEEDVEAEDQPSDPAEKKEVQVTSPPKSSKKSKKKKKKGKGKSSTPASQKTDASKKTVTGLDEIDQALLALNLTSNGKSGSDDQHTSAISEEMQQLFSVLSVDTQHLHAANEMRKLFGRAAVQGTDDDEPRNRRQQGGIAAAAAGRNQPGGRNLASLGLRRNIFIQGKEDWPRATLGGLGMELVEKHSDGTVEYRFVHNTTYQSVQAQFQTCVASMDPERMIQLMHFNPYHISTLLQVSEIAKQQRDPATSGELLERALFAFGRAVHSTFAHNLAQGRARLDFRRPENREFWLAVWRYIATLGIRATWRTAFEWAKLLISLAPEEDPYCMRLLIDQLALRGREPQALVSIVECDALERAWKIPPNLAYSVVLAHDRLKNPQKARSTLRSAIKEYPWIASRICRELEISPIPKSVWGKEPNGDHQELLCQLYVPAAKDLWNTTEGTSLLVEVCYSIEEPLGAGEDPYWLAPLPELDIARHVILSDSPPLLALLDPRVKNKFTSTSDPLPPEDSITSYSAASNATAPMAALGRTDALAELEGLTEYFNGIDLEELLRGEGGLVADELLPALERAGTTIEEFTRNTERVQAIQQRLRDLGVEVVFRGRNEGEEEEDEG